MKEALVQKILDKKLIAIVRGLYGQDCVALAEALYAGGIELMEVTFDQKDPQGPEKTADTIALLCEKMDGRMEIGAGTVTSLALLEAAKNAGAKFIISPDTNPQIIAATVAAGLISIPGAMTPTEILQAHNAGADFVKVFPTSGLGAAYIQAVAAPLNHVRLLAVGGVTEQNIHSFLKAGAVGAGVGGNLVNKARVAAGAFSEITALAQQFVANCQ